MNHPYISRRDILQLGALGACGLMLPGLLQARDRSPSRRRQQERSAVDFLSQLLRGPPSQGGAVSGLSLAG